MIHPLKQFQWMLPFFRWNYYRRIEVNNTSENLTAILAKYPHLMCIMNHGPTLAPLASIPALLDLFMQAGGEERKILSVIWRPIYKAPIFKYFASYVTNTAEALSLPKCLARYREGFNDILLMPEGDFCLFGNGKDIETFVSPKFIELALEMKAPILIAAHCGTDKWGRTLHVPEFLLPLFKPGLPQQHFAQLTQNQRWNLPKFPWRLKKISFNFRVYKPTLKLSELHKIKSPHEKTRRLKQEAQKIQQIMQEMVTK